MFVITTLTATVLLNELTLTDMDTQSIKTSHRLDIAYLVLGLIAREIPNHSPLSRAATCTICASYGPYTPTHSDQNYTGNPALTDVVRGFTNTNSPWTTVPPCLTSGENKTSVDILALPICLWVINHQFMNHKMCRRVSRR